MDELHGRRVMLTQDIGNLHRKGERGTFLVVGGYMGVRFDKTPKAIMIVAFGYPITNYVEVIEDDRPKQLSLFGNEELPV